MREYTPPLSRTATFTSRSHCLVGSVLCRASVLHFILFITPFPLKHLFLAHDFESFLGWVLTNCPPLLQWPKIHHIRCYCMPWSIAAVNAKIAETQCPLSGKAGSLVLHMDRLYRDWHISPNGQLELYIPIHTCNPIHPYNPILCISAHGRRPKKVHIIICGACVLKPLYKPRWA